MAWNLHIENIAGIRTGNATLQPGVNAVRASNWQGKSSLLTAIETVMGTARELTEGESHGSVRLETGDRVYDVNVVREGTQLVRRGEPYLSDEATQASASLYAFLDEDNAVRRAVRAGENLESVLTRPLDFENIDEQIADLSAERESVTAELRQAEEAADTLVQTEQRVVTLERELAELREKRSELAATETGSDGSSVREELSSARADKERLKKRIDRLERTVDRTREKITERRTELDELTIPTMADDVESRLESARDRHSQKKRDAELLQSVYAPTKRILDEERLDLITDVDHELLDDRVTCWTCGDVATQEQVEARLSVLGERVTQLRNEAESARSEVEELETHLEDRRAARRRKDDLEQQLVDLDRTLDERQTSLDRARERLEELTTRVETLSERVSSEDDRLTDVESELKYTEARLEDARAKRDTLEKRADKRSTLESAREEITAEIHRLRTRKKTLKRRTREAFDDAMQALLTRFDTGFETARLTSAFDLVVARNGREASLDALSEGEVELLGIVAALAGYEAFDTPERVPVMLVDRLGGLTDENVHSLISYLSERTDYLVVTAYPEQSSFEANTIHTSDWTVVSPQTA